MKFKKFQVGGHQERNKRAGTENVPAIVGLGKAIELVYEDFEKQIQKTIELRDYFFSEVQKRIKNVYINGDLKRRLPGNVNFSFYDVEAEDVILNLDMKDICVSNGSLEPSHVLLAMQVPYDIAKGTVRFSIGKYNTKEEIDYTINALVEIIEELRKIEKEEKNVCRFAEQCGGNCSGCHK